MFYYKLLILLVVITNGLTKPIENQPERCCFAKRFSSKVLVTSQNSLPDGTVDTSYFEYEQAQDVENGLFATRGPTKSAPNYFYSSFWNIWDYKSKVRYGIFPDTDVCLKEIITYPQEKCLSEDVTYTNSSIYNYNEKEILIDTWINDIFGSISYQKVSRNTCILLESGFIMESAGMSSTLQTSDYVEDIVDPTIFVIPRECH